MFKIFKSKTPKETVAKKKAVFKIGGLHCVSCVMNIDGELEDLTGVSSAVTSYAKGQSVIEYDPGKINEAQLVAVIEKLGYEVIAHS